MYDSIDAKYAIDIIYMQNRYMRTDRMQVIERCQGREGGNGSKWLIGKRFCFGVKAMSQNQIEVVAAQHYGCTECH